MRNKILSLLVLLLTATTGAWAQDPDPIDLTPSADGTVWTLAEMPDYDIELEVTYYTDEEVAEMEEAAYTTGVELTKTGDGEWTLAAMPAFDIELEVEYETDLALNEEDDNDEKLTEWNGYEADVTLTRTLVAGSYNTFAAPFSISSDAYTALQGILTAQGGSITVKELKSSSFSDGTLTLNFGNATEIKAGQPYLVKTSKALNLAALPAAIDAAITANQLPITNPFKGVIVSADIVPTETSAVDFIPTLGKTAIPDGDTKAVLFLGADNKLLNPESLPTDMKGFRAYFQLKGASEIKAFSLDFGDGEATGIQKIEDGRLKNENSIYDLQGRRMDSSILKKGVYIQNGKKVIIK